MNVDSIFEQFSNKKIAVLGDVMIDAYLRGGVSRISPEAPVPIIELQKAESRLGGAANVALNLLSLGAQPIICSLIGDDDGGANFMDLLNEKSLSLEGVILDKQRKTTIKTRIIGDNQHLLRIDDEEVSPINSKQENSVIDRVKKILDSKVDALIIEYERGWDADRELEDVLLESRGIDVRYGATQSGPHRADLSFKIGRNRAVDILSRGQQKILVSTMKIAQGLLLSQALDRKCIFLVDDLPSELDQDNRAAILSQLVSMGGQIFVSCVEIAGILDSLPGQLKRATFHVERGTITA